MGEVGSVGEGVDSWWLGLRVTGDTMLGCGRCGLCLGGRQHVCEDRFEIGIRNDWPGALAEQLLVPASALHALPDSVDTDMITPGKYLTIIDPKGLSDHILEGWRTDFPKQVKAGDILVAGDNLGCGSSREHAPLSMLGAGIPVVIARSFARIFYRNAINVGLPVMECPDMPRDFVADGDTVAVALEKGIVRNDTKGTETKGIPPSATAIELLDASRLVNIVRPHPPTQRAVPPPPPGPPPAPA